MYSISKPTSHFLKHMEGVEGPYDNRYSSFRSGIYMCCMKFVSPNDEGPKND